MLNATKSSFCAGIISLGLSATVEAALINGNNGLIYSTDLDITWFGFGNFAANSIYDNGGNTSDGKMSWANANNWAADLEYLSFTNWRLPTAVAVGSDPSCDLIQYPGDGNFYNYNCTGSEMGYLFYNELGGIVDIADNSSIFDETIFDGLLYNNYWSSTLADNDCYLNTTSSCAWDFDFKNGVTEDYPVGFGYHALAVHNGDIGNLALIPVPPAVWLFGTGLLGLFGIARRKTIA